MENSRFLAELSSLKSLGLVDVVEEHVLRQLAGVGETENVRLGFQADCLHILLMVVGQSSATDADVLALSKPLEPEVHEAQMPHLPTVIDESGFTRVGVNLEYLHHFDLEIEVKTFATFRRAVFLRDLR